MVYNVKGIQIKSHNAAKPISQASAYLLNWIQDYQHVKTILDYGCGKMRYSAALSSRCDHLTLVDSEIQLARTQLIGGKNSSVREQALKLKNARTLSVDEFYSSESAYDLILCANVLSAIPSWKVRHKVINKLKRSLTDAGECLFVTQFRDSYFTKMATYPDSTRHLDGVLVKSKRGSSFYGLINKTVLEWLMRRNEFEVRKAWNREKSAYVLAGALQGPGVGARTKS